MGIVLAIFYKNEVVPLGDEIEDDENDTDDIDPETQRPYWDVPEPDKDDLTVRYRFRR